MFQPGFYLFQMLESRLTAWRFCAETLLRPKNDLAAFNRVFEIMKTKRNLTRVGLLCVIMLPAIAHAQFIFITNADSTLTVTKYTGSGGDVAIPSTTNGYPVVSIGYQAFYGASLTNVTIPDSVTTIEGLAFYSCTKLTSVTIPGSVTNIIGNTVFAECFSLTAIVVE